MASSSSSSSISSRRADDDDADQWTKEEDKLFETALVDYEEGTAERWQKVALYVGTKTEEQVKRHYQRLLDDIEYIENSKKPLVDYPSSSSPSSHSSHSHGSGSGSGS